MHELVISSGRVALESGWAECDVGIDGERITTLASGLKGRRHIDASGHWVLPGGIDAHCHLDQPVWSGAPNADDFVSGSMSAAFGGTTCIVPFGMPGPGHSSIAAYERALACAAGRSFVDYALHAVVTPGTGAHVAAQLAELAARGVAAVKVYTTYEGFAVDDDLLLAVMESARACGMRVMVHAENDAAIRWARERLIERGQTQMRFHAVAHSELAEREAVHRVLAFAELTGAAVTIVHVSASGSLGEIERARHRGVDVLAETCPQYVFLTRDDLDRPAQDAARFMFTPPPRTAESVEALWQGLETGAIDLWSSDHSPYFLADKLGTAPEPGFHTTVSGVPGLETRLPLLFSDGLLEGRLSLQRYLDLTCRNAARAYGLAHRKGSIAPGFDADIVVWDTAGTWAIHSATMQSRVDFTPFEGRTVTGRPRTVLNRGLPLLVDGVWQDCPARGASMQKGRPGRSHEPSGPGSNG
ncbi:MAG: dihydropyrimidinase [Alsobacter sp.]